MRPHLHRVTCVAVLAVLMTQCSLGTFAVRDSEIERGVNALQSRVDAFLETLGNGAGTPAAAFETHQSFYDDVRSEIAALELRAALQRRNDATLRALEALEQNLGRLETLHRSGISAAEVPVLRGLFETQFQALLRLEGSKRLRKES